MKNYLSVQQLLIFLDEIHSFCFATDAIYLDFNKEFEKMFLLKLLIKLWLSGITGSLWKWFSAYLTNRRQVVSLNDQKPSLLPFVSGVSQENILHPLLFSIYINDLPFSACTSLIVLQYSFIFSMAINSVIFVIATNSQFFEYGHQELQGATKAVSPMIFVTKVWTLLNFYRLWYKMLHQHQTPSDSKLYRTTSRPSQFRANSGICPLTRTSLSTSDSSSPLTWFLTWSSYNNIANPSVNFHKDLGVIFTSDLSVTSHHQHIIYSAYKILLIPKRSCTSAST